MKNYRVRWEMDFEADSPEEAAQMALTEMRDSHSAATNFDVLDMKKLDWIPVKLPEE